jgi:preprotein translocase subunit YajC
MKKLFSILFVIVMLASLSGCMPATTGADGAASGEQSLLTTILPFAAIIVVFYFLMIRPQRKKEKKTKDMLNSLDIGDGVTTIGGIVGRVVSIKDDTVLVETGSDRTKMRFQKWAIQEVEKLTLDE